MKNDIMILKEDGTIKIVDCGEAIELRQLQDAVGGYIEHLAAFDGRVDGVICLVNENGMIDGKSGINIAMSQKVLWPIFGPVVFVRVDGEDFVGITGEQVRDLIGIFEKNLKTKRGN